MPNRMTPWNVLSGEGNPTRCSEINGLIRYIARQEVRGQAAPPQTRPAATSVEFRRTHEILRGEGTNDMERYGIPAIMNYQYHMIARIDDTAQAFVENIKAHDRFPTFVLKGKLNWSKNVLEERDAPWQIVLASNDPLHCVHLSMGVWLVEKYLESSPQALLTPYIFTFWDEIAVPAGAMKSKRTVQDISESAFSTKLSLQMLVN